MVEDAFLNRGGSIVANSLDFQNVRVDVSSDTLFLLPQKAPQMRKSYSLLIQPQDNMFQIRQNGVVVVNDSTITTSSMQVRRPQRHPFDGISIFIIDKNLLSLS